VEWKGDAGTANLRWKLIADGGVGCSGDLDVSALDNSGEFVCTTEAYRNRVTKRVCKK
jgi:hypothetical protein